MSSRRWRACPECDWVSALPVLKVGESAFCPRCQHELVHRHDAPAQRILSYATAALVMLLLTLPFSFLSFEMGGIRHEIVLSDAAFVMFDNNWPILALLIALSIIVLPGIFLLMVTWLYGSIAMRVKLPGTLFIARILSGLKPWLMTDVFLVGVLVSLAKLANMADIGFGWSFFAFFIYVILLARTVSIVDADWLWFALEQEPQPPSFAKRGMTAHEQGLVGCKCCGMLNSATERQCQRCHTSIAPPSPLRIQATWALLISALVLYIPANIYPMMYTQTLGGQRESTILGGVLQMVDMGSYLIALVIFVASFIVPIAKIAVLGYLSYLASKPAKLATPKKMQLYRLTEVVGRWSMIDVFVVAIMVALIQGGVLLSILPGAAAVAFAGVVVLTMIAANTFDPRLLWQAELNADEMNDAVNNMEQAGAKRNA
ncbi:MULTISPECIES: paraquat-inducible protein A [Gammaproteobacteria]|uniref:paraquat-inducible protein A n=1 Tax=Gammaproteobacteria TaxID=1236 RepID=UPI000DD06D7D|nr:MULTISPECIES: paraquat-inducible protein A [Gammaproteobacteria]RTE86542.1 paraquat-inducible protein A [Aliidiomarina sp. B3213]TCZ90903.1 paraquat-inducible protein A [Lysobacter sp. N42]